MQIKLTPETVYMASFNTLIKLTGFGTVFAAVDSLVPGLYPSFKPVVTTVIALTTAGSIADFVIVPKYGNMPSLMMGFFGMSAIIWICGKVWPGSHVTVGWAVILTLLLGPLEYFLHKIVLRYLRMSAS